MNNIYVKNIICTDGLFERTQSTQVLEIKILIDIGAINIIILLYLLRYVFSGIYTRVNILDTFCDFLSNFRKYSLIDTVFFSEIVSIRACVLCGLIHTRLSLIPSFLVLRIPPRFVNQHKMEISSISSTTLQGTRVIPLFFAIIIPKTRWGHFTKISHFSSIIKPYIFSIFPYITFHWNQIRRQPIILRRNIH